MDIGVRLNNLRRMSGESLQQVADAVGISKAHIWELEKGRSRNPSYELMQRLAVHFGVSIAVLSGEAEEPAPAELQVERIHRELRTLSARDLGIIEEMVRAMAERPQP
jgi:transcriptional regulator with XRE-family HTH domain